MNKFNYLAMLKAKQGEANAIANLSNRCLSNTALFFDIPRPKEDTAEELEKKIDKSINIISDLTINDNCIYFDIYDIPLERRCTNNIHPLVYLENKLLSASINFVPVYGFDRDVSYFDAISNLKIIKENGLCIRLIDPIDLYNPTETLDKIRFSANLLKLPISKIDIIIDLRSVISKSYEELKARIIDLTKNIAIKNKYRSVSIVGSSFPKDMTNIERDSHGYIQRLEFNLWKDIASTMVKEGLILNYGDYTVVHPDFVDPKTIITNANAKIRYVANNSWFILRGHSLKKEPKFQQYIQLSDKLVNSRHYLGKDFSWGDKEILIHSREGSKTGNLATWVSIDVNHHLEYVSLQVNNYVNSIVRESNIQNINVV